MKIKPKKITGERTIEFSTSVGSGIGILTNHDLTQLDECIVELDIEASLEIGANSEKASQQFYSISHNNISNEIIGRVDGVDADGMIYFRLSTDCIIMIENELEGILEGEFLVITIPVEQLKITVL